MININILEVAPWLKSESIFSLRWLRRSCFSFSDLLVRPGPSGKNPSSLLFKGAPSLAWRFIRSIPKNSCWPRNPLFSKADRKMRGALFGRKRGQARPSSAFFLSLFFRILFLLSRTTSCSSEISRTVPGARFIKI